MTTDIYASDAGQEVQEEYYGEQRAYEELYDLEADPLDKRSSRTTNPTTRPSRPFATGFATSYSTGWPRLTIHCSRDRSSPTTGRRSIRDAKTTGRRRGTDADGPRPGPALEAPESRPMAGTPANQPASGTAERRLTTGLIPPRSKLRHE